MQHFNFQRIKNARSQHMNSNNMHACIYINGPSDHGHGSAVTERMRLSVLSTELRQR